MDLPDHVHALTLTADAGDRTVEITPTAVETEDGLLLVDVGFASTLDGLRSRLADIGFDFEDVRYLLLTHEDGDHAAGAHALLAESNPVVVAHELEAPAIDGRRGLRGVAAGGDRYTPVDVDVEVGGPMRIRTLAGPAEIRHTPGHTSGHVSVYLPEVKTLLSADALTSEESTLDGPKPQYTEDMNRAMEAVASLATLDVDRVVCHHGGPVEQGTDSIQALVDEYDHR